MFFHLALMLQTLTGTLMLQGETQALEEAEKQLVKCSIKLHILDGTLQIFGSKQHLVQAILLLNGVLHCAAQLDALLLQAN